jgi:hypothetical protein
MSVRALFIVLALVPTAGFTRTTPAPLPAVYASPCYHVWNHSCIWHVIDHGWRISKTVTVMTTRVAKEVQS